MDEGAAFLGSWVDEKRLYSDTAIIPLFYVDFFIYNFFLVHFSAFSEESFLMGIARNIFLSHKSETLGFLGEKNVAVFCGVDLFLISCIY